MSEVRDVVLKKWRGQLVIMDKESNQPLGGQLGTDIINKPDGYSEVVVRFLLRSDHVSLSGEIVE